MFRTIFRISIAVPLVCCSSASNDHQSLLMGIWVSDKAVTLREAKKEGQNLPEWIREKLGKSSVVINRRKMSSSELSAPPHERTWLNWSVTSETEDFVYISGAIQRYNKNLGCLEQHFVNT